MKNIDQAEVWHQVALYLGRKPTKKEVCLCIEKFGKNDLNAYKLSYRSIRKENEIQKAEMAHFQNCGGIKEVLRKNMENNSKATALKMVRRLFEEDLTSYTKVPFVFEGHLFFCSPSYGSKDYNKTMTCAIVGNEKFIERIEKLCERIISKKNH